MDKINEEKSKEKLMRHLFADLSHEEIEEFEKYASLMQLPLPSGQTYNFVVDWGDGNSDIITAYDQAETLHTYSSAFTGQITITGKCGGSGSTGIACDETNRKGICFELNNEISIASKTEAKTKRIGCFNCA